MTTFDREERLRRMLSPSEAKMPKPSKPAMFIAFCLRLALIVAAVALVDVGLDGDYDLSLFGMARVAFGGLIMVAMACTMLSEAIGQRLD